MKLWENEKCCWITSHRRVFPQLFQVLPNFHECFYNSIEMQRTCFLFLLENTIMQKTKSTCLLCSSKCKFSLFVPSLRQKLVLVLCFYRVIETQFYANQREYLLLVIFLNDTGVLSAKKDLSNSPTLQNTSCSDSK